MTGDRPFRICWTQDQATRIFRTEALEGNDAVFLATHTPIAGFDVAGRDAAQIVAPDERSVLDALARADRRHAFCVVQGEPGSGKSHLIRWLSVNWPGGGDVKLLLRRADGSLEGALAQLRDRLPAEFHELFEGLGVRQRASLQGRANIFLSWLANTLDPGHYEQRPKDEDWCADYRPGEILSHPKVKADWQAPSRILKLLEGAGGKRNSESASFDVFDVANLGLAIQASRHTLGRGAKELARRLETEGAIVAELREADWLASDIAAERAAELPYTLDLVDVLNRRKNDAIQNVLGVSAESLKTLFRRVRQELQRRGERLVLLLEDITSWEGLDDSLIDVLVQNAEASGGDAESDVCPLISVVGLTPAYYDRLQGNYRQRITHEIRLGHATNGLQDVASLRDPEERVRFAARYLAAVRAGMPALRGWRDELADAPDRPPPNVCDSCPKQPSCHPVFGASDGIGLFPLTERALGRFFEALKVDDNGQTWRTPRGLLQAVLNPCLAQPDLVDRGEFPGRIVESVALERARLPDNAVSGRLQTLIEARIAEPQERARYRRAATFWGNPESADTLQSPAGDPMFAGMSERLASAFDLPWLGEGEPLALTQPFAPAQPTSPEPVPPPHVERIDATVAPLPDAPAQPDPSVQGAGGPATAPASGLGGVIRRPERPDAKTVPPSRNRRTLPQREAMREELRGWAAGGSLENSSRWNDMIHELVTALDARMLGVAPFLLQRVVTPEMVKLQGSTAATRNYLVVPPEPWVRAGLEGALDLEMKSDASAGDRAFSRRNVALMMGRLERLVQAYLVRRLPVTADGRVWSPVPAMVQVLQARAWLRGAVEPDTPPLRQLSVLLSDEDDAQNDPASRSGPWLEWLNATRGWHERIRSDLRAMTSLAVDGGGAGAALVDSSEMAGAVARFAERGFMDEVPEQGAGLPDAMAKARELVGTWTVARSRIVQVEYVQVKGRAGTLGDLLRNRTIADHLERLGTVIAETSALLPNASPDLVTSWVKDRHRQMARLHGELTAVEDLILAFDDEASIPSAAPARLKWLSAAPVRALEDAITLVQAGERAVVALHAHARDAVQEAGGGGSLEEIKTVGRRLIAASEYGEKAEAAA